MSETKSISNCKEFWYSVTYSVMIRAAGVVLSILTKRYMEKEKQENRISRDDRNWDKRKDLEDRKFEQRKTLQERKFEQDKEKIILQESLKHPQPAPEQKADDTRKVAEASKPCQFERQDDSDNLSAATPPTALRETKVTLQGLHFYRGGMNLIAGRPGHGKSLFAMGRANEFAQCSPNSVVLYFDTEYDAARLNRRIVAQDGKSQQATNLHVYNWRRLTTDKQATASLRQVVNEQIDGGKRDILVVVDNISDGSLKLNYSSGFLQCINQLAISAETKGLCLTTLLLLHPKVRRDVPWEFRAEHLDCSPAFQNQAITVTRLLQDKQDAKLIHLKLIKDRDGVGFAARLRIVDKPFTDTRVDDSGDSQSDEPAQHSRPVGRPPDPNRDEMMQQAWLLRQQGLTQQQIADRLKTNQRRVSRLLSDRARRHNCKKPNALETNV